MQSIPPVPCPKCGERQNVFKGRFDPEQEPFGGVSCMVCSYEFEQEEYRELLSSVRAQPLGPLPV
jgi:hypothetical protein